ncbi:MAG: hypothetical protein MUF54_01055 [Polyangiaceae bacterium]|nr:hypothetical protein [Polyangiaceae bacterium]
MQAEVLHVRASPTALLALLRKAVDELPSLPGSQDRVRAEIRDLLRRGGFTPSG